MMRYFTCRSIEIEMFKIYHLLMSGAKNLIRILYPKNTIKENNTRFHRNSMIMMFSAIISKCEDEVSDVMR